MLDIGVHIVAAVHRSSYWPTFLAMLYSRRNTACGLRANGEAREEEHHSQPICRPLFCSSSQVINGLKYSIIARVEMSSPVASFKTLRQSSVPPFFKMLFSQVPTSLLSA